MLGISRDTVESQKKFAEKYGLKYSLLADRGGEVVKAYDAKSLLGLAKRMTFLVDKKGRIAKVYESVNPMTHAARVAEDLAAIK